MSQIIITRARPFGDFFGSCKILIDGVERGSISYSQTVRFDVPEGHHHVLFKFDSVGPEELSIDVGRIGTSIFCGQHGLFSILKPYFVVRDMGATPQSLPVKPLLIATLVILTLIEALNVLTGSRWPF